MERIIKAAVDRGASDLHIKAGDVFRARINGRLVPLTKQALTPDQTKAIAQRLVSNEEDRARLDRLTDYDCSWGAPGVGRFRVNILRQRSSFMVVMRVIPFEVPSLDRLALPAVLPAIATAEHGLILVTGTSGAGKSSTMAAFVNHVNATSNRHIVTLERPIEFLHRDLQSSVTQREVGVDTPSYREGLSAALRQDPDVIVLGEVPDAATMETVLQAAERGHLVITSLPTPDVAGAFQRMLGMVPAEEQEVLRVRLAEALVAIVAQRLVPRADGRGRVAAVEVLRTAPSLRDAIRVGTRLGDLRDLLAEGGAAGGSQTFDDHLGVLVREGTVAFETALAASARPSAFEREHGAFRRAGAPPPPEAVRRPTPFDMPVIDDLSGLGVDPVLEEGR